jgi:acetylornithine/N-succinyldiaminopimelate aminotransferase
MKFQKNTEEQYQAYRLKNYGAPSLTIVKGENEKVWDDQGNEYLDFVTGIATASLGHCHPSLVKAIHDQANKLIHVSNLYQMQPQGNLCEALVSRAGPGGLFFCNSGAEASETLIKLSRLFGNKKSTSENPSNKVIVFNNGFHGRTFGGMSATPQEKIQQGFFPMLNNFPVAQLNDIESVEALADDDTVAIFVEPIQGEGGIHVASDSFLQNLRQFCTEKGLLLLLDEVQSGTGRTGTFFAHESAGIKPDAIGMAKGLGGGFPIGAVWVSEAYADLFTPGSHGSTFGGNPMACAAALAVLETIEKENLLQRVCNLSRTWIEQLNNLAEKYESLIEIRGRGFLIGMDFSEDPTAIQNDLQSQGLLTVRAGGNILRLLPPLTVPEKSLHQSIEIIDAALAQHASLATTH